MDLKVMEDDAGSRFVCCRLDRPVDGHLPLSSLHRRITATLRRHPGIGKLVVDLRRLDDLAFGQHEGRTLHDTWLGRDEGRPCPRTAILVANDLVFGLCRMYHALVHHGSDDLTVWRDATQAATWLDLAGHAALDGPDVRADDAGDER